MAKLDFDAIFSSFLGEITDYGLASENEIDAGEGMTELLHKAVARPFTRRIFSSATFDDGMKILTFEMDRPIDDETDQNFVTSLLGKGMVLEWISPKVNSTLLLAQMFTGGDQKWFAQRNHLEGNRALKEDIEKEVRSMINDRDFAYNSYIGGA